MSVYHNPNALHPIPIEFFEGFSGRHWIANGVYDNLLRDFSPSYSLTILYSKGYEDETGKTTAASRRKPNKRELRFRGVHLQNQSS